jgi:hypothetical protein
MFIDFKARIRTNDSANKVSTICGEPQKTQSLFIILLARLIAILSFCGTSSTNRQAGSLYTSRTASNGTLEHTTCIHTRSQPWKSEPESSLSNSFITRNGDQLKLGGKRFRFGGANIYWLGLEENINGIRYPTKFKITEA